HLYQAVGVIEEIHAHAVRVDRAHETAVLVEAEHGLVGASHLVGDSARAVHVEIAQGLESARSVDRFEEARGGIQPVLEDAAVAVLDLEVLGAAVVLLVEPDEGGEGPARILVLVRVARQAARVIGTDETEVLAQARHEGVALLDDEVAVRHVDEALFTVAEHALARLIVAVQQQTGAVEESGLVSTDQGRRHWNRPPRTCVWFSRPQAGEGLFRPSEWLVVRKSRERFRAPRLPRGSACGNSS